MSTTSQLPIVSSAPSLDFCNSKETYLQFVAEWKAAYHAVSLELRYDKLAWRIHQSDRSKSSNPRALALMAILEKMPPPQSDPWIAENEAKFNYANPWRTPHDRLTYGMTALASWMLWLRAEAKKAAHAAWEKSHLTAN